MGQSLRSPPPKDTANGQEAPKAASGSEEAAEDLTQPPVIVVGVEASAPEPGVVASGTAVDPGETGVVTPGAEC
ncbi:hypothetical protein PGT21_024422 [Puccinia graminis f. sp. tritici]|uniref:Uncharacterized protein n=1 Tax=Puccinia graminis f. sp. tritici TaxID=56615 RepID=A0A5B0NV75_PUCGR|nr:hypothetical protein PGT21_024422 [Puccinia graminis f. sp. tritici]